MLPKLLPLGLLYSEINVSDSEKAIEPKELNTHYSTQSPTALVCERH